ncbi:hypothetical protein GCM10017673_21720 [Streptosporangium violaceochromogenes]|nr:hypothetical protein GCM10017673_21720 [Streptosporangium violaceochromogenes]
MQPELWNYQPHLHDADDTFDIAGYHVEATDGKIGSVDEATYDVGESYLVVDTGPWIFGKKVLLPAGTVTRIDPQERSVHIARTKDEIKHSPEFDEATFKERTYRDTVGDYYGRLPGMGGPGV